MTLREYLMEKDEGTLLKIGANDGSSFFYCGTAGDFLANIENIDRILFDKTRAAKERMKKEFLKSMQGFIYTEKAAETAKRNAEGKEEKKGKEKDMTYTEWTEMKIRESTEGLRMAYNEWLAIVAQKQAAAIAAEKLVSEPRSVLDRKVITVFLADAIVEPEVTINVLVYGWEIGQYWTLDEALNLK